MLIYSTTRILPFLTSFTPLTSGLKNCLRGWLLVLGLKKGLVECATACVESEVILIDILLLYFINKNGPKFWPSSLNPSKIRKHFNCHFHRPLVLLIHHWTLLKLSCSSEFTLIHCIVYVLPITYAPGNEIWRSLFFLLHKSYVSTKLSHVLCVPSVPNITQREIWCTQLVKPSE